MLQLSTDLKGSFEGKGVINNQMANFIFKLLEKDGIKTHLVEELSPRETLVKKVDIIPLEVIVRNVAAGSFQRDMALKKVQLLLLQLLNTATRMMNLVTH